MKIYKQPRVALLIGFALIASATGLAARAESDIQLLVHHRLMPLEQTTSPQHGNMQVQIVNAGAIALKDATLRLDAANLQILPATVKLGTLAPAQAKTVDVAFHRSPATDEPAAQAALLWRVDYKDAQGAPAQISVLDNGAAQPPLNEK